MRRRPALALIAAANLLAGSAAHAGVLTAATWTQTIQGVDLTVTNNAATCTSVGANIFLFQQTITCPAAGLGATGSSAGSNYSVSLTMGAFALNQYTIGGINLHTKATFGPGAQVIIGNANTAGATMGIPGKVTVQVAAHVNHGVFASFLAPLGTTLVRVPLSVGKAGVFTGYFYVLSSPHYITVDFYAWTVGTQTFAGLTTRKAPVPSVIAMGSFGLTANGGGTVTLVAPSRISIDGPLSQRRTASFATLKLSYAPEPGTLLLLGAAAASLALVERRRRTRG